MASERQGLLTVYRTTGFSLRATSRPWTALHWAVITISWKRTVPGMVWTVMGRGGNRAWIKAGGADTQGKMLAAGTRAALMEEA